MIYDYSLQCPKCNSYHTEWVNELMCLVCSSCNNHIKLQDDIDIENHKSLMIGKEDIMPEDKVMVYDTIAKKDRIGIVVKRYGITTHMHNGHIGWPYPDLCDVKFSSGYEWNNGVSKGHFTYGLEKAS